MAEQSHHKAEVAGSTPAPATFRESKKDKDKSIRVGLR